MKYLIIGILLILSGCKNDPEIAKSEILIAKFKCSVDILPIIIEEDEVSYSLREAHFNAMKNDRDKVRVWFKNYKEGHFDFNEKPSVIILKQFELYKQSCEALGGTVI